VRKSKPTLPEGEELGADWERWARDSRPHRLKRKRDFDDVDPAAVKVAAQNGAARLGKAVHVFSDPFFPDKFVWVQFADHPVVTGRPCPCGSRRLLRLHNHFARCPACGAQLLLKDQNESEHLLALRELTDVHLERHETEDGKRDLFRGYGRKDGMLVLVIAEFRRERHEELTAANVYDHIQKTKVLRFQHLEGFIEADPLLERDESDWDLVFSAPEIEPEPERELERDSISSEPLD
jgi:DNA-directed RNA polymerase subunit RPC12/RpoP